MNKPAQIEASIIVVPRERYSCTPECIENIYRHTEGNFEVIVVNGNSDESVRSFLKEQAVKRAGFKLLQRDEDMTAPGKARNIACEAAQGKFLAILDNDVMVTEGWLEALIRCAEETGASAVTPVILIGNVGIHAAGTHMLVAEDKNGEKVLMKKILEYCGVPFSKSLGLMRRQTEYGEMHAILIRKKVWETVNGFDEEMIDLLDLDFLMKLRLRDLAKVYFEPEAVVKYMPAPPLEFSDLKIQTMRWSPTAMLSTQERFKTLWGINVSKEAGWRTFLIKKNKAVGFLARILPWKPVFEFDQKYRATAKKVSKKISSLQEGAYWRAIRFLSKGSPKLHA